MKLTYRNLFPPALISAHAALLSLVVVLGTVTVPAHGASLIQAFILGGGSCQYSGGDPGPAPSPCALTDKVDAGSVSAAATKTNNAAFPQVIGASSATLGSLGNFAHGISRDNFAGGGLSFFAEANFKIDDLMFTGPGGPGEQFTTRLNFFVDGAITTSTSADDPGTEGKFFLAIRANGGSVGSGTITRFSDGSFAENLGYFAGLGSSVNQLFTTGDITFTTGVAQSLQFSTFAKADAGLSGNPDVVDGTTVGEVKVDFSNTTNLPTAGPIFNLGPGFSVSSASAGIANNQFGGVIPVPAALPLLLTGLASLGLFGWRRRKAA